MKSSRLLNISLLTATVLLAACAGPKDNSGAAKIANPNLRESKQRETTVTAENATCSKEVTDALNAVMSQSNVDLKTQEKDSLVLMQKACEAFDKALTKQVGEDSNCRTELEGASETQTISKDTTKEFCGSVDAALKPATEKTDSSTTKKPDAATSKNSGSAPVTESPTEVAPVKKIKPADTKIADLKKGLLFTIKKVEILSAVLMRQGFIQDGVLVEATGDLDNTLSYCELGNMSFPLKIVNDQTVKMTSIKIEERTLTLANDDASVIFVCQRPPFNDDRDKAWGFLELTKVLDGVVEIKAID